MPEYSGRDVAIFSFCTFNLSKSNTFGKSFLRTPEIVNLSFKNPDLAGENYII